MLRACRLQCFLHQSRRGFLERNREIHSLIIHTTPGQYSTTPFSTCMRKLATKPKITNPYITSCIRRSGIRQCMNFSHFQMIFLQAITPQSNTSVTPNLQCHLKQPTPSKSSMHCPLHIAEIMHAWY